MTKMSSQESRADYLGRPARWEDDSACNDLKDPNVMYPENGAGVAAAKAICARCTVVEQCYENAITAPEPFGVRGELSERQRKPLRKIYVKTGVVPPRPTEQ